MSNDFNLNGEIRLLNLINKDNVNNIQGIVINNNDVIIGAPTTVEGERNTEVELVSIPNTRTVGSVTVRYNRLDLNDLKELADIPIVIGEDNQTPQEIIDAINSVYGSGIELEDLESFTVSEIAFDGTLITLTAKESSLAWINEIELLVKLDQDQLSTVFTRIDLNGLNWPAMFQGIISLLGQSTTTNITTSKVITEFRGNLLTNGTDEFDISGTTLSKISSAIKYSNLNTYYIEENENCVGVRTGTNKLLRSTLRTTGNPSVIVNESDLSLVPEGPHGRYDFTGPYLLNDEYFLIGNGSSNNNDGHIAYIPFDRETLEFKPDRFVAMPPFYKSPQPVEAFFYQGSVYAYTNFISWSTADYGLVLSVFDFSDINDPRIVIRSLPEDIRPPSSSARIHLCGHDNHIFALSYGSGVFNVSMSKDEGITWTRLLNNDDRPSGTTGLLYLASAGGKLLLLASNSTTLRVFEIS